MKNLVILLPSLATMAFLFASCGNTHPAQKPSSDPGNSEKPSAVVSKPTLDFIVGGPFVFVQGASCGSQPPPCLAVWAPKVKGHTSIIGLAAQVQYKQFDTGDYDFTSGLHPSATTTLVTPVQSASIYSVSTQAQKMASSPKKKPFATLILPTPREIVSWNADPMTISANGSLTSAKATDNLATLTILRYDYQEGDALEVKTGTQTFWKPQPFNYGSERIIVVGFVPPNPSANEDEHKHALEAFSATTAMLGSKWSITFNTPPSTFQRNRPPDPNWPLPQDLLNIIDQIPVETKGKRIAAPINTLNFELFGKINDCKAPAILVTP
jgi:hypothetical protein